MKRKYRGLVVHKLKPVELAHLGSGKEVRARFSAPTFRTNYAPQAADVGVALLPKSVAAQWHFGIVSSSVPSVGFLEAPCTLKHLTAEKS
jgi:hypothetical protein